jgi:membrane-associated protease RseP (regulator of RpoE activity)
LEDFIDKLIEALPVIACLPLCIIFVFFIHEFAHYLAARLVGLKVESVSIGIGKKIIDKKDALNTNWQIRLFPIKAHVHIADYHPEKGESLIKRLFIILAGPLSNFILPFFLFFFFFLFWGKPYVPPIITGIELGTPAYKAGLEIGDEIISINGSITQTMDDVLDFTQPKTEKPLLFEIKRNDELLKYNIMPQWEEYRDLEGTIREHGRIGVMAKQIPNDLEMIKAIEGVEIKGEDEDEEEENTRQRLKKHLGSTVVLGLKGSDREVHDYKVYIDKELNQGLFDIDDEYYDSFFAGRIGENSLMQLSIAGSAIHSYDKSSELVMNMLKLPFNLFPIDKEWISPGAKLTKETSFTGFYIYKLVFLTALFSVLIGWINLVPFPGFDGYVILMNIAQAFTKNQIPRKKKAIIVAAALSVLYISAFIANAPDLSGYFEFKIEELTEED